MDTQNTNTIVEEFINNMDRKQYLNYAFSFTKDDERSEDLLHDSILRALSKKDLYVDDKGVKTWFYMIMRNQFINWYRRYYKYPQVQILFHVDELDYQLYNYESIDLLTKIESQQYRYYYLIDEYIKGTSYKELSEKYGRPIGTIKSQINYVRKLIKMDFSEIN